MSETSGESIDAILSQIKEFTRRTEFSSNDFPSEGTDPLIDDISITSSLSEARAETENDEPKIDSSSMEPLELLSSSLEPEIPESDFNADVSFFLLQMSKVSNTELSSLDDVVKLFKQLKYGNNDENTEIFSFVRKFNDRFNVAADSLDDVLDLMDIIQSTCEKPVKREIVIHTPNDSDLSNEKIAALETHNRKLTDENISMKAQLDEMRRKLEEAESRSNFAKLDSYKGEEKSSLLEHNLRKSEAQVKSLKKQLEVLTDAKQNAEKAYNGIEELLRTQISETTSLAQQRDQLVSLLRKQNEICQRYDDHQVTEKPAFVERVKPVETVKIVEKIVKQDNIELLVKVCQRVSEKLPAHMLQEIIKIRDSNASTDSRIIAVANCISDYLQVLQSRLDKQKSEAKTVDEQVRSANESCERVLRVLENELRFMQRLVSSSDLQDVVFYRPKSESSLVLDADSRNELLRHSMLISKFIEENIGCYAHEQVAEMLDGFDEVSSDGIFDLMENKSFGERASELLDTLANSESCESRIIYDLFFAQTIMSEIMKKHVESLQSQVVYTNHEMQKMRAELDNQDAVNNAMKDANKVIRKLQRREKKLTKELNKLTQVHAEKEDLFTVVGQLEAEIAERDKEITRLTEDIADKSEKLDYVNKHIEEVIEAHDTAVKQHEVEIEKMKKMCDSKDKHAAEAKKVQKEQQREWKSKLASIQDNVKELSREKGELLKCMDLLHQCHKAEVNAFVQQVGKFDRQLKAIEVDFAAEKKQKEDIITENHSLNDKLQAMAAKLQSENDAWKSRLTNLQSQYESARQDCAVMRTTNDQLSIDNEELETALQETRCELEAQKIQQRSLEIRLKTESERFENEKRTLSSQLTAKITAYRNDFMEQLDKADQERAHQMQEIVNICHDHLNNSIDLTNPVEIARLLEETIEKLEADRKEYIEIMDDFAGAQSALEIDHSGSVTCAIRKLQDDLSALQLDCDTQRAEMHSMAAQIEKQKREAQLSRADVKTSQMWESWAKRMHNIMNDARCATLSGEQLRASLEEVLMASIAHRSLLFKMSLLKDEKKALVKFNKDLLLEKSFLQGSWRALIVACAAIKRMQQRAGCVPLAIGSGRQETRTKRPKPMKYSRPLVPIMV